MGTASAESTFFPFSMHTGPAEATSQTAGAALVVFAPSEITSDSLWKSSSFEPSFERPRRPSSSSAWPVVHWKLAIAVDRLSQCRWNP